MMPNLVPANNSDRVTLARHLLNGAEQPSLPATFDNRPRTFVVIRMQAGQAESDALIDCLALLSNPDPLLVLCGGPASSPYKSHPDDLKRRFDVFEAETESQLIDLRLSDEFGGRHMIAVFDPNLAPTCLSFIQVLTADPFNVPVDVIYVASRTERHLPFVDRCRDSGTEPIIAEQRSLATEHGHEDRLVFPAIPRPFIVHRETHSGLGRLNTLLKLATPGTIATFRQSLLRFQNDLRSVLHG